MILSMVGPTWSRVAYVIRIGLSHRCIMGHVLCLGRLHCPQVIQGCTSMLYLVVSYHALFGMCHVSIRLHGTSYPMTDCSSTDYCSMHSPGSADVPQGSIRFYYY